MKYFRYLALITVFSVLILVKPISAITTYAPGDIIATINFTHRVDFQSISNPGRNIKFTFRLYPEGLDPDANKVWHVYNQNKWLSDPGEVTFNIDIPVYYSNDGQNNVSRLETDDFQSTRNLVLNIWAYNENPTVSMNVSLTAIPYAIHVNTAVLANHGEAENVLGTFNAITIDKLMTVVSDKVPIFTVDDTQRSVGIGTSPQGKFALNVSGTVNANAYYKGDELKITENSQNVSFDWAKADNSPAGRSNLYYMGQIGNDSTAYSSDTVRFINNGSQKKGVVNATKYFIQKGGSAEELTSDGVWQSVSENILYTGSYISNVGIGTSKPKEKLHINGAIRITSGNRDLIGVSYNIGTLAVSRNTIVGMTSSGSILLTGTRGQGQKDYLTYIDTNVEFKASPIKINSEGDIIIGKNPENISPEYSRLNLYGQTGSTLLQVKTSQNMTAMTVSENGNVSIKTDDSRYALNVSGNMYVKYIYINGRLLGCTYSITSRWLANRNEENCDAENFNIYYENPVGIGSDETQSANNASLELSGGYPTKNAAITFSGRTLSADYTVGVNHSNQGFFSIESGHQLGKNTPLLSITSSGNLGVGITTPNATLHVSGNLGLLITGDSTTTQSIQAIPNMAQFIFDSSRGSLRVGFVNGNQWASKNFQQSYAMAMGESPIVNGAGSTVFGGSGNTIKKKENTDDTNYQGEYSFTTGYHNTVYTNRSIALGQFATANHRNVFVFSGDSDGLISNKDHQFIISAKQGVGIATSSTGYNGGTLTVANHPITASDFMDTLSISSQNAYNIIEELVSYNYITTPNGNLYKFNPEFRIETTYLESPFIVTISAQEIRVTLDANFDTWQTTYTVTSENLLEWIVSDNFTNQLIGETSLYNNWQHTERNNAAAQLLALVVSDHCVITTKNVYNGNETKVEYEIRKGVGPPDCRISDNSEYARWTTVNAQGIPTDISANIDALENGNVISNTFFTKHVISNIGSIENWNEFKARSAALISQHIVDELKLQKILKNDASGKVDMNSYRPTFNFFSLEGVSGITKQNVYAILKSRYNHAIMDASRLRIRSPGYVGIGVTTPNNALNISGNVVISNQSFTSLPQADFTLESDGLQDMMTVFSHHNTVTPSMLINNAGQVIVGGQYISPSDNSKLRVYGSVISTGMALPSGQKISTEDPKIYFQLGINDNIYFTSGNVGIGTPSSNSLLELSGSSLKDPLITFDVDDSSYISIGMDHTVTGALQIISGNTLVGSPILAVAQNSVGIHTNAPSESLHVVGTMAITSLNIGNAIPDSNDISSVLTVTTANFESFEYRGEDIGPSGVPWTVSKNFIYYDDQSRGIGIGATYNSGFKLDVSGTFNVIGTLSAPQLNSNITGIRVPKVRFKNPNSIYGDYYYPLFVSDNHLFFNDINLSDRMTIGEGGIIGNVATVSSNIIGETALSFTWDNGNAVYQNYWEWDEDDETWVPNTSYPITANSELLIPGKFTVLVENGQSRNEIAVSNNYQKPLVNISSELSSGGHHNASYDFTAVSINVHISTRNIPSKTIGLDISMLKPDKDNNFRTEIVQGILVDLCQDDKDNTCNNSVQITGYSTKGHRYAALFMGDIGIGTIPHRPTIDSTYSLHLPVTHNLLEINGGVTVNYFQTSLFVAPKLKVDGNALVVTASGNIGIGTETPQSKLEVNGRIRTNRVTANSLSAGSLSLSNALSRDQIFVVNPDGNGFVGIGITEPSEGKIQHELHHVYKSTPEDLQKFTFKFLRMMIATSSERPAVPTYSAGLVITVNTAVNNSFGAGTNRTATGLLVDLSKLNLNESAGAIGVSVNVSTGNAATFMGGYVGIGTTSPQHELDINGTLRASSATGNLQYPLTQGIVSYLTVLDGEISEMVVTEDIHIATLVTDQFTEGALSGGLSDEMKIQKQGELKIELASANQFIEDALLATPNNVHLEAASGNVKLLLDEDFNTLFPPGKLSQISATINIVSTNLTDALVSIDSSGWRSSNPNNALTATTNIATASIHIRAARQVANSLGNPHNLGLEINQLSVPGKLTVSNNLSITGDAIFATLNASNGLNFSGSGLLNATTGLQLNSSMNVSVTVNIDNLQLTEVRFISTNISNRIATSALFVNNSDIIRNGLATINAGSLVFIGQNSVGGSVSGNMLEPYANVTRNHLFRFTESGPRGIPVSVTPTEVTLTIASENMTMHNFLLKSFIPTESVGIFNAKSIEMDIMNETWGQGHAYRGLHITVSSNRTETLSSLDTLIGIEVDVSSLNITGHYFEGGVRQEVNGGKRYATLLKGGPVEIIPTGQFTMLNEALLYVSVVTTNYVGGLQKAIYESARTTYNNTISTINMIFGDETGHPTLNAIMDPIDSINDAISVASSDIGEAEVHLSRTDEEIMALFMTNIRPTLQDLKNSLETIDGYIDVALAATANPSLQDAKLLLSGPQHPYVLANPDHEWAFVRLDTGCDPDNNIFASCQTAASFSEADEACRSVADCGTHISVTNLPHVGGVLAFNWIHYDESTTLEEIMDVKETINNDISQELGDALSEINTWGTQPQAQSATENITNAISEIDDTTKRLIASILNDSDQIISGYKDTGYAKLDIVSQNLMTQYTILEAVVASINIVTQSALTLSLPSHYQERITPSALEALEGLNQASQNIREFQDNLTDHRSGSQGTPVTQNARNVIASLNTTIAAITSFNYKIREEDVEDSFTLIEAAYEKVSMNIALKNYAKAAKDKPLLIGDTTQDAKIDISTLGKVTIGGYDHTRTDITPLWINAPSDLSHALTVKNKTETLFDVSSGGVAIGTSVNDGGASLNIEGTLKADNIDFLESWNTVGITVNSVEVTRLLTVKQTFQKEGPLPPITSTSISINGTVRVNNSMDVGQFTYSGTMNITNGKFNMIELNPTEVNNVATYSIFVGSDYVINYKGLAGPIPLEVTTNTGIVNTMAFYGQDHNITGSNQLQISNNIKLLLDVPSGNMKATGNLRITLAPPSESEIANQSYIAKKIEMTIKDNTPGSEAATTDNYHGLYIKMSPNSNQKVATSDSVIGIKVDVTNVIPEADNVWRGPELGNGPINANKAAAIFMGGGVSIIPTGAMTHKKSLLYVSVVTTNSVGGLQKAIYESAKTTYNNTISTINMIFGDETGHPTLNAIMDPIDRINDEISVASSNIGEAEGYLSMTVEELVTFYTIDRVAKLEELEGSLEKIEVYIDHALGATQNAYLINAKEYIGTKNERTGLFTLSYDGSTTKQEIRDLQTTVNTYISQELGDALSEINEWGGLSAVAQEQNNAKTATENITSANLEIDTTNPLIEQIFDQFQFDIGYATRERDIGYDKLDIVSQNLMTQYTILEAVVASINIVTQSALTLSLPSHYQERITPSALEALEGLNQASQNIREFQDNLTHHRSGSQGTPVTQNARNVIASLNTTIAAITSFNREIRVEKIDDGGHFSLIEAAYERVSMNIALKNYADAAKDKPLLIGDTTQDAKIDISTLGKVTIGRYDYTRTDITPLWINAPSDLSNALTVKNKTETLFDVSSGGVAIGTSVSNGNRLVINATSDPLKVRVNGNNKLVMNSDGNIGINTSEAPSGYSLEVSGDVKVGVTDTIQITTSNIPGGIVSAGVATINVLNDSFKYGFGVSINTSYIYIVPSGNSDLTNNRIVFAPSLSFQQSGQTVLTVKNKKVGIGTTEPDEKLHVHGNLKVGDLFEVKESGDVLIGNPTYESETALNVSGSVKVKTFEAGRFTSEGPFRVSDNTTATMSSSILINYPIISNAGGATEIISGADFNFTLKPEDQNTDTHINANVRGLSIRVSSKNSTGSLDRATGLYVDVSNIEITAPFKTLLGRTLPEMDKIAALFVGDYIDPDNNQLAVSVNVGIQTINPSYNLHVVQPQPSAITQNIVSFVVSSNTTSQAFPTLSIFIAEQNKPFIGFKYIDTEVEAHIASVATAAAELAADTGAITTFTDDASMDNSRDEAIYQVNNGNNQVNLNTVNGRGASFNVVVADDGTTTVTLDSGGTGYVEDEVITIPSSLIGGTDGGTDVVVTIDTVTNLAAEVAAAAEAVARAVASRYPLIITTQNTYNHDTEQNSNKIAVGISVYTGTGNGTLDESVSFNETLLVNGDIRLGVIKEAASSGPGDGNKVYFSGGAQGTNVNSENKNPLYMFRRNETPSLAPPNSQGQTELRVVIRDDFYIFDNKKSNFSVVVASYNHLFTVYIPPALTAADTNTHVGIGTKEPKAPLHIHGNSNYFSSSDNQDDKYRVSRNLMVIQNQEDLSGNSLMITHTQFGIANSKKSHNFMTFISEGNNLKNIGAIEGTSGSSGAGMTDGVLSFSSPDRDYAEYMPKRDPSEQIQYGDVVGVFSGKVSKQTQGADLVMAISSTPIIVGNWPGTAHQNDHAIVGFLGQIPVKVKGPVKEGDLLIPSGHNDGWAIAIHPEKISSQWINSVIGQALESHTNPHVKKVNTLIGFDFKSPIIGRQIQTLKSRVKHLKKQNKQTKEKIEYYDRRRQNQLFLLQNKGRLR